MKLDLKILMKYLLFNVFGEKNCVFFYKLEFKMYF